jgi:hypothetical protein
MCKGLDLWMTVEMEGKHAKTEEKSKVKVSKARFDAVLDKLIKSHPVTRATPKKGINHKKR